MDESPQSVEKVGIHECTIIFFLIKFCNFEKKNIFVVYILRFF